MCSWDGEQVESSQSGQRQDGQTVCVCVSLLPSVGLPWAQSGETGTINRKKPSHCCRSTSCLTTSILMSFSDLLCWPLTLAHSGPVCLSDRLIFRLQFSFSFVETHAVSAVRIRPSSAISLSEEESEEENNSKTTPIIQSEGAAFPWNIDGELVEITNEVLIRYHEGHNSREGKKLKYSY